MSGPLMGLGDGRRGQAHSGNAGAITGAGGQVAGHGEGLRRQGAESYVATLVVEKLSRSERACANGRFAALSRGWLCGPGGGFPTDPPREEPSRARDPTSGRRHSMGIHSIGIHSNGMDIPMECIRNGMDWYGMHCNAFHTNG